MTLAELAAARRTHKEFGPEPVDRDTLLELLAVARFAPTHHMTELKACAGESESKKLDRAPTLVVASAALFGDLVQDEEDVCAAAAAILLVLLAATERGIATYWRTPAVLRTARGREAAGIPSGERFLGLLHFGTAAREPAARARHDVSEYVTFLP